MLMFYLFGCKAEPSPKAPKSATHAIPETQAAITIEGIVLDGFETGYAWFSFANPAPPEHESLLSETCRTEWEGESWYNENIVYGYGGDTQLDAGDITLRIGEYITVNDNPTPLYGRPPTGEAVWFEADGGNEFPSFAVPELVTIPNPPEGASFSFSEVRFDWRAVSDGASVEITVRDDQRRTLICRAEDDGVFSAPRSDLDEMGMGEIVSASLSRERVEVVIDGDVLVRGSARQTVLFGL